MNTNISFPSVTTLKAVACTFAEGGDAVLSVKCMVGDHTVHSFAVTGRNATPSDVATLNPARTSVTNAFTFSSTETIENAAFALKIAARSGQSDDESLEAMLSKAVEIGLVVL